MLATSMGNDPSQSRPLLFNTLTFGEPQDKRTPAADVRWAFCTLQCSTLIENNRKTFLSGSGPSLRAAPNRQKISGLSISAVYAPTDQWPPQSPPRRKPLEMLFCPYLSTINPCYRPASRRDKFPLKLYGRHQLFSLLAGTHHLSGKRLPRSHSAQPTKDKNHTDAFESNPVSVLPAAVSTHHLSAEGTRALQVHSVPCRPLRTHRVYLCNPAETWLGLVKATSSQAPGPCLFLVLTKT